MIKYAKNKYIILFVVFIVSYQILKTDQIDQIKTDLERTFQQRKKDYLAIFQYILENGVDSVKNIENKQIIIASNMKTRINLGDIRYITIPNSTKLNVPLNSVIVSDPYFDETVPDESLVDLSYYSKIDNELKKISTTIFYSDFFKHIKKYDTTDDFNHNITELPGLLYENNESFVFRLLFVTLFFISCFGMWFTEKVKIIKRKLTYKNKENEILAKNQLHLSNLNSLLKRLICLDDRQSESLEQIIQNVIKIYSPKASEKNIKVIFKGDAQYQPTNKDTINWYSLIISIVESCIEKEPPNSVVFIGTKKVEMDKDFHILELFIKDKTPFQIKDIYINVLNTESTSNKLNLFVKVGFNESDGNTLRIVISNQNEKNIQNHSSSNIVSLFQ